MNLTQQSYYEMALLHTYYLIAFDEETYREITELYNQNEVAYKKRIQEFEKEINSSFIIGLPIDLKWKTLKTMAVLERSTFEEKRAVALKYIKKGYKRIYDFAQMNPQLNVELAVVFINQRYNNYPDAITDRLFSVYFLSLPKTPQLLGRSPFEMNCIINYEVDLSPIARENFEITDEIKVQALNLYTKLTKKKWRGSETLYLDQIFLEIEAKVIMENPKVQREVIKTGSMTSAYSIEPLKYVRFGQSIFQMLGMDNLLMHTNIKITKDEWYHLYHSVQLNQELKDFSKEDIPMMMCYALLFFGQYKLYQQLAEQYKEQLLSVNVNEINQARAMFEEEQKIAQKEQEAQIAMYTAQINHLTENMTELQQEKELLEKQVKRLQLELEKQQNKAELSERLLETLFNETTEEIVIEDEISLPEKVVYIGGHPSLQKQLKEQYPNWYLIAVDDLQRGEQQVKQADLVIFNAHYNNHAQFERLKVLLRPQCVLFAKYGSNIQLHIQDIQMQYQQIQQKLGV